MKRSTGATSHNDTFAASVTAGNTLILHLGWFVSAAGTETVTDGTNTWTLIRRQGPSSNCRLSEWRAYNVAAGSTTVTITPPGTGSDAQIVISEWSGLTTTDPLDVETGATTASGTSHATGSTGTTTQNNELVMVAITHTGSTTTLTQDGTMTLLHEEENGSAGMPINTAYKSITSTGTQSHTWSSGANRVGLCGIFTLKEAAAAATSAPPPWPPAYRLQPLLGR